MVDSSAVLYSKPTQLKKNKESDNMFVRGRKWTSEKKKKRPCGCWAMVIKHSEYCNIKIFVTNINRNQRFCVGVKYWKIVLRAQVWGNKMTLIKHLPWATRGARKQQVIQVHRWMIQVHWYLWTGVGCTFNKQAIPPRYGWQKHGPPS